MQIPFGATSFPQFPSEAGASHLSVDVRTLRDLQIRLGAPTRGLISPELGLRLFLFFHRVCIS
jgi:hypothetical protein